MSKVGDKISKSDRQHGRKYIAKKWAESGELSATDTSPTSPYSLRSFFNILPTRELLSKAINYEYAAKQRLSAREPRKAAKDFLSAAKYYDLVAKKDKEQPDYYLAQAEDCRKNAERVHSVISGNWHGLEGKASGITTIVGIIGGLFFLSSNFTGNVIGNMTNSTSNIFGAALLIVGLVGGFYWVNNRKRK